MALRSYQYPILYYREIYFAKRYLLLPIATEEYLLGLLTQDELTPKRASVTNDFNITFDDAGLSLIE